jgi:hypothetical protein
MGKGMKKPRIYVVFTHLRGFLLGAEGGIRTLLKSRIYVCFKKIDYDLTT